MSSAPPGNGGYQLISHCVSMYLKIHQIVNIFRWHPGRKNIPLLQVYLVKRSVVKGTRKVCYISFGVFSINIKLSAVDSSSILQWYSNEGIQDIAMHNGAPEERHGKCVSSCEAQRFFHWWMTTRAPIQSNMIETSVNFKVPIKLVHFTNLILRHDCTLPLPGSSAVYSQV